MMQLILIRHGQTPWTKEKRYQGSTDIELSAEGRRSMKQLAPRLQKLGIEVLYTSAMKRAKQSGEPVAKMTRLKPRIDARLNEIGFGVWEGKTAAELFKNRDKVFLGWIRGKWKTPEGGEPVSKLRRRAKGFLKDCLKRHDGKTVAVVSHGGLIRMIIREALGLSDKHLFSFQVDPASVSVLRFMEKNAARLLILNSRKELFIAPKGF